MATSEPLVPQNLEQGERQEFVAAARAGGIALANPARSDAVSVPPSPRPTQAGIVPPNFDVFANRQPGAVPGDPVTPVDMRRQRLLEHPNPVYRDLARRVFT
jgi:hypothetical protein